MVHITCGVTMLISWNSLCSRGHGKILQFDRDRMMNVQIGQNLAGISLIVGSIGTLRWIGELGSDFTTVNNVAVSTTVQYGWDASEPLKSRFEKSSLSKMVLSIEFNLEKFGFATSFIGLNMKIGVVVGLLDGTGTVGLIVVA